MIGSRVGRSARRRAIAFIVGFVAMVAMPSVIAIACTDISGSGDSVLSLQFDTLASPSVVVGDTLRDTTGAIILPVVHAFNYKGGEIASAKIYFQSPDSGVTVDSASGVIVADSLRTSPARIIATVGKLQAIQKINVTLRPDSITSVNALDTLTFSLLDSTKDTSAIMSVKLSHGVSSTDSVVSNYIVSFDIVSQSNPNLADLATEALKLSRIDTTDGNGIAGRRILVHPVNLGNATAVDSVIIQATAKYRGQPVAGSPVRLVVVLKPGS
ncbi:MAG TPA: hypothetical protein VFP26_13760 [Gemmatimonadaceae bacterium]|jgi:hypothetical protein|nr:hypothetical protein [Gemmatimonadaceae bacterium]